jgi:hypothetical protein
VITNFDRAFRKLRGVGQERSRYPNSLPSMLGRGNSIWGEEQRFFR